MMSALQIGILLFINGQIGANKQYYVRFETIYSAYKKFNLNEGTILAALAELTNMGYLESRERSYRITISGFIFIEAYAISKGMQKELQEELNRKLLYQWLFIAAAFVIILIVVLQM